MWSLTDFPPNPESIETLTVLRACTKAHRYLAELKGVSQAIPNQGILINTLSLQEAKDSSAIENIVTTHDELFRQELFPDAVTSLATKEVHNYALALRKGFDLVKKSSLIALARECCAAGRFSKEQREPARFVCAHHYGLAGTVRRCDVRIQPTVPTDTACPGSLA